MTSDLARYRALADRARDNTADGLTAREALPDVVDALAAELERARSLRLARPADAVDPSVHTPERVITHLRRLGWFRESGGRVAQMWHPVGSPDWRLPVPMIPAAPDYAKRLGFLASDLAEKYETGELAILALIETAAAPTNEAGSG